MSPNGGLVPLDPRSMKYMDEAIWNVYEDKDFLQRGTQNTLKPNEIKPNEYSAIYYTGGHGVMWDFPDNSEIQAIARQIYMNNGYLVSLCHGIAGLLNLKDDQGNYIIAGKKITVFTTSEEILAGKKKQVPFLNQKIAKSRDAIWHKKRFYKDYALIDIITGQNPFSVRSVAKPLIRELNNANNLGK
ncbi:type 1 glutamine amidotransferase domain-containing protein [Spiroplasma citri]|uniref:Type 1 glutamine amidotransferase domain-containing protein n=1 Tax=Spiroplasma citri TaxID=2133 RepID=A0AAX3T0I2_SPICI|nr:type 1 glutamine amidotransferase domain-containing protein [Spiroplasma citri]WFG96927.1 type 1 glutamine amidotransferase domain-containing protein [Spiroplasma citri]WFH00825.1 type 1 glutamine amidotransferase domain-containing protein [Spiroplasma citri]